MGEARDRMRRGDPYDPADPELVNDRERCHRQIDRFNAARAANVGDRDRIIRALFGQVGADVEVEPPLSCDYGINVSIGDRSFINYGGVILDCAAITIGADVQIGPNVQLLTPTHPLDPAVRRTRVESAAPIVIHDGVWLGGGVIVGPGVTIGADTVVGAGSVVLRDLPAGVLAVGNPARVVRELAT
jgi:maltose O-acetyltransferase